MGSAVTPALVRRIIEVEKLLPSPRTLLVEFSRADTDVVTQIVKRELKSKESDERILKLTKAVLTSLFKQLYTRRSTWKDGLTLQAESLIEARQLSKKMAKYLGYGEAYHAKKADGWWVSPDGKITALYYGRISGPSNHKDWADEYLGAMEPGWWSRSDNISPDEVLFDRGWVRLAFDRDTVELDDHHSWKNMDYAQKSAIRDFVLTKGMEFTDSSGNSLLEESDLSERDDINKLPLTRAEKSYARGSGMEFLKTKQKRWMDILKHQLNPKLRKKGFPNSSVGEFTSGKKAPASPFKGESITAQRLIDWIYG